MATIPTDNIQTELTVLLDQFRSSIGPYILDNVKEFTDPSAAPNRRGSDGQIIDLDWDGKHCVGKELHELFFERDNDVEGMRTMLQKFCREIRIMTMLKHDNIVPFLGIYYKQSQNVAVALPVLIMEKLKCSLTRYIETSRKGVLSDVKTAEILCDVARGLEYLHEGCSEPLAHRDLSSNNILLTATLHAKIADFGSARVLDRPGGWNSSAKLSRMPGTLHFMPPETEQSPPWYTTTVDIFSFGCVIIHLVTWEWPEPDSQIRQVKGFFGSPVSEIVGELDRRQKWIALFGEHHSLLPIAKRCLQDRPNNRPKCTELLSSCQKVLEHYKMRKIIIFGRSNNGKTMVINKMTMQDCRGDKVEHSASQQINKTLMINNSEYTCTFIDAPGFSDSSLSKYIWDDVYQRIHSMDGLNMMILVLKKEDITKDSEVLSLILTHFRNIEQVLAIVITNCTDDQDDQSSRAQLTQLLNEKTKNMAPLIEQRICTVGFPQTDKESDLLKLYNLIERSSYFIPAKDFVNTNSYNCSVI